MYALFCRAFDDRAGNLRARLIAIYSLLAVINLAVWAWALLTFRAHPLLSAPRCWRTASACGTRSMPTISRRSTTSPAS